MDLAQASEAYRPELLAHCYRMLGSPHDAEDVVQETMLRAWRFKDGYDESRGAVRTWLYRIATNACLSFLEGKRRRALPVDLGGPSSVTNVANLRASPEITWLEPFPDSWLIAGPDGPGGPGAAGGLGADPGAVIEARDGIRLAFVAALQHLPPRQRAVLILRDVLAMPAAEAAGLLETSVASVNSALRRARAQLAAVSPAADGSGLAEPTDAASRDLLERYMAAFAALDVAALLKTLREDALLQMPPYPQWFLGRDAVGEFLATAFARGGSYRLTLTRANGQPAVVTYARRHDRPGHEGAHRFLNLQVLTPASDGIARIDVFRDSALCGKFGLPVILPD
jgi:RNA polymerase sigma-70 factor (ECF subfamily)